MPCNMPNVCVIQLLQCDFFLYLPSIKCSTCCVMFLNLCIKKVFIRFSMWFSCVFSAKINVNPVAHNLFDLNVVTPYDGLPCI